MEKEIQAALTVDEEKVEAVKGLIKPFMHRNTFEEWKNSTICPACKKDVKTGFVIITNRNHPQRSGWYKTCPDCKVIWNYNGTITTHENALT